MQRRIGQSWVARGGIVALGMLVTNHTLANGEAEYVAPIDVPVSSAPGRTLPYPVVEEPQPRGTPSNATEPLPDDFIWLATPEFSEVIAYQNAVGEARDCSQAVVVRGTRIDQGKITIPAGGLGYVTETWPAALPLRQDAICIAGVPNTLIDLEQSIVTRKNVTLEQGQGIVLGSEVFGLRQVTEFGDARSAVVQVSAISGFDWARLGTGSLEVSTTEPGWHAKTFHYGMHQGRLEEVAPKSARFAWLSGIRTDSIVLAEKREFAALVAGATDIPLSGGGRVRVVRVIGAARQVQLETPDGPKILNANVDRRGLPADTAARRKLLVTGSTFAVVLVPEASDFGTNRAHMEVYSHLRQYQHGNLAPDARAFKTYPIAHYTGAVVGLYWVNEQPIVLTPSAATVAGPNDVFKLVSTWNQAGELAGFQFQDPKGATSALASAAGRKSINFLGGNGPTLHSILARVGAGVSSRLHERLVQSLNAPSAASPCVTDQRTAELAREHLAELSENWLSLSPRRLRLAAFPAAVGAFIGLLLGLLIGRARR